MSNPVSGAVAFAAAAQTPHPFTLLDRARTCVIAVLLSCAVPTLAWGVTLHVAEDGSDGPACGLLGDIPGEELGAPDCRCAVAVNKPVILVSSNGAAVTFIDIRNVALVQNVLLITDGGEFGRPSTAGS
jgi:hypothetical protein